MKILIIYFSQTGNTLKMAECIRDGIVEVTGPCDLKALREVDADSLAGYDLVGLGTPVFYFQEPFNVRDSLKDLPHQKGRFEWKMDPASIDFSDSLFRQRERKIRERKEKASRG